VLRDFQAFVTKESLVNLGVAVVLAIAFGTLIRSLVTNLLLPLVAIPGESDFGALAFTIGGGTFRYGAFLEDLITFVLTAAGVFFVVVRPLARLASKRAAPPVETSPCGRCLSTVPAAATKCPFCTADLLPA
jgi:large conductance mechanosensitive channel